MTAPFARLTMAILAWVMFGTAAFMLLRGHENGLISFGSILLALAALVPKKELELKRSSKALRIADFLASTYLVAFLVLSAIGLAYVLFDLARLA
jgi:hypothetical protein